MKDEIIEMLQVLISSIATCSSEDEKYTVLDNIKPSSFQWIISETIELIEGADDEET